MANNVLPDILAVSKNSSPNSIGNPLDVKVFDFNFSRILERKIYDTEEIRYDIPLPNLLANSAIFMGVALDGSLTSDAVWSIVKVYFDGNGLPTRMKYRTGISWDNRTVGW